MPLRRRLRAGPFVLHAGAALCACAALATAPVAAQQPEPFVVGFTASMLPGVSRADAQAAMAVWAHEIAATRGLHLTTTSEFFETTDDVRTAVDSGRVHLVLLSVEQYLHLRRPDFGELLMGTRRGQDKAEYLLVTKKGAVTRLAELKGTVLQTVEGTDHDMATLWLETLLHAQGLPAAARHFASITQVPKVARGVLPVFFGQAGACLVTRGAFELMVELNPQIGTALVPLAVSPPLVSSVVLFDRRYAPALRARMEQAFFSLHESPRGQQVLSFFGVDRIVPGSADLLGPSLALARDVDRLRRGGK